MLNSCANENNISFIMNALSELERSTCDVWVDHFSLDFRKAGSKGWLYTQEQPSVTGALKVYELATDGKYDLWILTETRMTIGLEKGSKPLPERKTWNWNNWDSYEIPGECQFISHKHIQYEF
jgi:hypothetical protein